ncbi:hypothetical protein DFH06DRAFT_1119957 [Mycena polygramma]|nr:hypothetical protein DFH06DRAFT_1119957 [Mycena polygramma]
MESRAAAVRRDGEGTVNPSGVYGPITAYIHQPVAVRPTVFHFFSTFHHVSSSAFGFVLAQPPPHRATRKAASSTGISLHPPLPAPTRRPRTTSAEPANDATSSLAVPDSPLTPLSDTTTSRESPPHLPQPSLPTRPSARIMSKLEFPKLTEDLTPAVIHGWIGRCEDTFEAWQALNPERKMEPRTLITLAGLKMEESTAATWWNENRDDMKKLGSFAEFAQKVKDRFVASNWRMDALTTFYSIHQNTSTFPEFAKTLQTARNALSSAGSGFTISDSILKNHLLFHSHPILRLRICGQQSFPYATVKVDTLIATMSSAWASLIAEGVIRVPRVYNTPTPLTIPAPASTSTSLPTPPPSSTAMSSSTSRPFLPLTHADKEALRAAGGCYHCRKTPQTPGWVKHRSDSCPGDAALGIPPRSASAVVAAVGPVGFSSTYEEGYSAVAVVMPAYNPEEDDYSSGSDDNDLSRSY